MNNKNGQVVVYRKELQTNIIVTQCCSENDAFFASTLAIQCNHHNFANVFCSAARLSEIS